MTKRLMLLLLLPLVALASDTYSQTVTSTGTSAAGTALCTNSTGCGGMQIALRCDANAYYRFCNTSSCTATTNDQLAQSGTIYDILMASTDRYPAVISVSGTANCRVYKVVPATLP